MIANLNSALCRYREDRFSDRDIVGCTGLSARGLRELIKRKAIRTEQIGRGPGQVRICDATTLKRVAVIAALNQCGLSLAVAGQVAFFLPYHTLLYAVCDPITILFENSSEIDLQSGLPPRIERPLVDWFDPLTPAKAEADIDWQVIIFDGRFVGVQYDTSKAVTTFGELRQQSTQFVAWMPFPRPDKLAGGAIERIARERRGDGFIKFIAEWEDPSKWLKQLRRIGYRFEHHDHETDPLRMAAQAAVRSAVVKTEINVTLAVRKALRRYLNLEPPSQALEAENRY
jgi:hypothetical protein